MKQTKIRKSLIFFFIILFVISVGWLLNYQLALGNTAVDLNRSINYLQERMTAVPNRIQTRRHTVNGSAIRSKARNGVPRIRPFRCECGRSYGSLCSLQGHKRWECGKEPSFNCPYCSYMAKQKSNVTKHIRTKHVI